LEVEVKFRDFSDGDCSWLGQEKQDGVPERNNYGNLAMDVQPLFGLVLSWEDYAILVYYLAIKCLVIALVMMSIRDSVAWKCKYRTSIGHWKSDHGA